VKRPPGSPPAFKARYVARGFSQRQGVDYFQSFSPTPKMTTVRVLLHVAAQRDYELHSLDFSTDFAPAMPLTSPPPLRPHVSPPSPPSPLLHQNRFYRSPEVVFGHAYGTAIDLWSLGCVAAELFLGLPLFLGASKFDMLHRMVETMGSVSHCPARTLTRFGVPSAFNHSPPHESSPSFIYSYILFLI
ncbi:unnamed protein product, partial [Closterium sp. NIES-53]